MFANQEYVVICRVKTAVPAADPMLLDLHGGLHRHRHALVYYKYVCTSTTINHSKLFISAIQMQPISTLSLRGSTVFSTLCTWLALRQTLEKLYATFFFCRKKMVV